MSAKDNITLYNRLIDMHIFYLVNQWGFEITECHKVNQNSELYIYNEYTYL